MLTISKHVIYLFELRKTREDLDSWVLLIEKKNKIVEQYMIYKL